MTVLQAVAYDVPPLEVTHFCPTPQVSAGLVQTFEPQSSGVTVATGHCFVHTVHSAGFLQPGSHPSGRSSSGTGQTFAQAWQADDGADVVEFIFAGSQ